MKFTQATIALASILFWNLSQVQAAYPPTCDIQKISPNDPGQDVINGYPITCQNSAASPTVEDAKQAISKLDNDGVCTDTHAGKDGGSRLSTVGTARISLKREGTEGHCCNYAHMAYALLEKCNDGHVIGGFIETPGAHPPKKGSIVSIFHS